MCIGLCWNLQTFIQRRRQGNMGSLVRSTIMKIRATEHFHRGLLLSTQRKEKEFQRNTMKCFWSFCFSKESKARMRKTIYMGKLLTSKIRTRNIFGFSLILLLNKHGKETKKKLQLIFFLIFFQTYKKKARKRK